MTDDDILARVKALVAEERATIGDPDRRRQIEQQLDQCWDLLRQRQAQRESGGDPDAARSRPVSEVENYLQ